jgi:hypothetical protein
MSTKSPDLPKLPKSPGPQLRTELVQSAQHAATGPYDETHYTIEEIARQWQLSCDSVRRLFKDEPGVLAISPRKRKGKRPYMALRVPQSVLARVHRKLSLVIVLTK